MWKLTITQKRKSEYSDYLNEHQVEFVSEDMHEVILVAEILMGCETALETSYKIEKGKEGEGNEV